MTTLVTIGILPAQHGSVAASDRPNPTNASTAWYNGRVHRPVAVLLAAGGGSRFRGATHKLLAPLLGKPVYRWAIQHALDAGLDVVVITGCAALDPVEGVTFVHNDRWADGQATSLQCAVEEAQRRGLDAFTVGLGDQPFVTAETWRRVSASESPIAVANYDGIRGNPVRLSSVVWNLLPREGDLGARNLLAQRPDLVEDIPCDGSNADIDTLEDLQRWNSSTNSP